MGLFFWSHYISGTLLERVQQKAYRCFLGTGRKHPLAEAAGDMCWMPTACRHRIQYILFWITIMKKEETRMSRKVFLIAKEYAEVKGIKNWAQQVKSILASCNLMCWWDKNASTDLTIRECKEVLSSIFYRMEKVQWEKEVLSKAKLQTYHLFKREFITEQYTNTVLCGAHRSLLAKLRGGSAPLEIRYTGIPADQRVCNLCSDGVEEEIHFSVKCIALDRECLSLFSHMRRLCPTFDERDDQCKFISVITEANSSRNITKCLFNMFVKRNTLLSV